MNYVLFGRTWHDTKQFEDRIMLQTDFLEKYGPFNETGNVQIDDDIFSVLLAHQNLVTTIKFMNNFRSAHIKMGYKNLS